jgi:hypothetical protein
MKVKICIINYSLDLPNNDFKKINSWFDLNLFEMPFLPQIGMKIDLDDFYPYSELNIMGYAKIKDVIIYKDYIELHC